MKRYPNSPRGLLALGLLVASGFASNAQPITPVWEYTLKNLPAPLPVLTNALNGWTTDNENGTACR